MQKYCRMYILPLLEKAIQEHKPHKNLHKAREMAKLFTGYYTGEGLDWLLWDYRKLENDAQKQQRKRITIQRPKHVCSQIENIIDHLNTLDSPAISIRSKSNESKAEEIERLIYELNIIQQAFQFVKYYNMTDANAFVICSKDELELPQFDVIDVADIWDFRIKNERVLYLVVSLPNSKFRIYLEKQVIDYTLKNGVLIKDNEYQTNLNYAYFLGMEKDAMNKFQTFKAILEPASEMLKQLLWDGSEYDTIKLCHGIVKQFAYAPKCTYQRSDENGHYECNEGVLHLDHSPIKEKCPICHGSGMRIHTSNQDIIFMPEPMSGEETVSLDKLTHTIFIPDSILESRKKDIQDTEDKIIRTVFNSNNTTKDEVAKTATEMTIDLKGVYSMLTKVGNKVTETFIWMVECMADMYGIDDIEAYHGYTYDMTLESLDAMFEKRRKAVESGVTNDIVRNIDRAIIKKQNMENPTYIDRVDTWESFKPFNDKTPIEKISILSTLPDDNYFKVLYTYWGVIQRNVVLNNENFYELERVKQQELIDNEVEAVKELIKVEPERPNLDFD